MREIGKRKRLSLFGLAIAALIVICAAPAIAYYDDFGSEMIDADKWLFLEGASKVDSGVLVKTNRAVGRNANNKVHLVNPAAINPFKASVTITAINDSTSGVDSYARLEGVYYNVNASPTSNVGDFWVALCIGDRGSGLEAWYEATLSTSEDWSEYVDYPRTTITDNIDLNATYQLEIIYDETTGFVFNIYDGSANPPATASFAGPDNEPNPIGPANSPTRAVATCAYANETDGEESHITAEFDNIYNGDVLIDDFSSEGLDPGKWDSGEFVRKIDDEAMMLYTRGHGTRVHTRSILNEATDYLEAKVSIDAGSWVEDNDGGTTNRVRARIEGNFFNDTYNGGYNGYEGDVWTQIALDLWPNGTISASCYAERYRDAAALDYEEIFWHPFTMPIETDHDYRLIIVKTDSQMVYAISDLETDPITTEIFTVDLPETVYEAYDNFRMLRTRVYEYGGGGEITAHFDNVATEPGNVSGHITTPDGTTGKVYVVALPYTSADDWTNQFAFGDTEADPDTGYYELYAPEGEYFIAAYQDVNENGERDDDEPAGFVGNLNLGPESVYFSPDGRNEDFAVVFRPSFVFTELERNHFPESGTPDWMPTGEVIMAEAEIAYGGSNGIASVTLTGANINNSDENGLLRDNGVFPDEFAGDNIYTGYVATIDDSVGAGPYSFLVIDGIGIANISNDQFIAGSSIDRPTITSIGPYVDAQPITFSWDEVPNAAAYSLLIIDPLTDVQMVNQHLEVDNITSPYQLSTETFEFEEGKTYTWLIIARDATGANVSISNQETFTVYPALSIPNAPETPPIIQSGGSFVFEASGGDGDYTWSVDGPAPVDGGEGDLFTFDAPEEGSFAGVYTITLTDDITGWNIDFDVYVPMRVTPISVSVLETGFFDIDIVGAPEESEIGDFTYQILDENGAVVEDNPEEYGTVSFGGPTWATYHPGMNVDSLTKFRIRFIAQDGPLAGTPVDSVTTGYCWVVPVEDLSLKMVDAETGDVLTPDNSSAVVHPLYDTEEAPDFDPVSGSFTIYSVPQDGTVYRFFLMADGHVSKTVTEAQVRAGDIQMEPVGVVYSEIRGRVVPKDIAFIDPSDPIFVKISVQKNDGEFIRDSLGEVVENVANPDDGSYTFVIAEGELGFGPYTVNLEADGYIPSIMENVIVPEDSEILLDDVTLNPITRISVTAEPLDLEDPFDEYDSVRVTIEAFAGQGPLLFEGNAGEIRVENANGQALDVEFNPDGYYTYTYPGYDAFSLTILADVGEDRDVDSGYFAYTTWYYVPTASEPSTVPKDGLITPDNRVVESSSGKTRVTVPPGGISGDITGDVQVVIVEADSTDDIDASLIADIQIFGPDGNPLADADINEILITMSFDTTLIKNDQLRTDPSFAIYYTSNLGDLYLGNSLQRVQVNQIVDVDYNAGWVTFRVDHLTSFGIGTASAIVTPGGGTGTSGTTTASSGGGGGCFVSQLDHGNLKLWWLGLLSCIAILTACLKTRIEN